MSGSLRLPRRSLRSLRSLPVVPLVAVVALVAVAAVAAPAAAAAAAAALAVVAVAGRPGSGCAGPGRPGSGRPGSRLRLPWPSRSWSPSRLRLSRLPVAAVLAASWSGWSRFRRSWVAGPGPGPGPGPGSPAGPGRPGPGCLGRGSLRARWSPVLARSSALLRRRPASRVALVGRLGAAPRRRVGLRSSAGTVGRRSAAEVGRRRRGLARRRRACRLLGRPGHRCAAPVWAALIASTSCAFFMPPAPAMPMPPAIDFRSASSMELSPPPRFLPVPQRPGARSTRRSAGWWIRWFPSREVLPTYQCRTGSSAVGLSVVASSRPPSGAVRRMASNR